ncbi:unnamed protein product [Phyllotreta striolata]|uniref:Carboxylic ester hydrolase n=1 Tax=Phyllotreta striolata TaxID=444603 RepID=A0A9N9TX42_PHYSR|nr:unnamed protein product [Phyllotreta striolata]
MLRYLLVLYFLNVVICNAPPTVTLPSGTVEGFIGKTENGQEIFKFEGIPYARPPVGDLRFEESVPPKPWKGVWKANTIFKCMQYNHYSPEGPEKVLGDEDCLYVNVYTPTVDTKAKLDVLVYIHGGAFMFNHGGQTLPDIVLDRNVVFVNLNYRLGPLGFLSTEDQYVPGNNGIKDQMLALKWIKDNVESFGGNPESITISGMSAGGASVHTHLISPRSKGLFSKAISQSGVVTNAWVFMENPLNKTQTIATSVGCPIDVKKDMMKCLKSKPARQIAYAVKNLQVWLYNPFSPFGLVVDKWAKNPVFPEHPYQLLKKGLVQDLPWITSFTSSEGLYPAADFYFEDYLEHIDQRWNEVMPYILHYNEVAADLDDVSARIRTEYLQNKPVSKQTFPQFVEILSDRLFIADIVAATRLHASAIKSPVYSYFFNYRGAHSKTEARILSTENIGVSHGDDTSYVFKTLDVLSTKDDRAMSKLMVDMFVSFMKTGKPNVTDEWVPQSKKQSDPWVQLRIDSPYKLHKEEKTSHLGNADFWHALPLKENHNLEPQDAKDEL